MHNKSFCVLSTKHHKTKMAFWSGEIWLHEPFLSFWNIWYTSLAEDDGSIRIISILLTFRLFRFVISFLAEVDEEDQQNDDEDKESGCHSDCNRNGFVDSVSGFVLVTEIHQHWF